MLELKSEKSTVGKKLESVFSFQNDKGFLFFKFVFDKRKAFSLPFYFANLLTPFFYSHFPYLLKPCFYLVCFLGVWY
jgi:hypothetical protein